jgi:hypothetical protein
MMPCGSTHALFVKPISFAGLSKQGREHYPTLFFVNP